MKRRSRASLAALVVALFALVVLPGCLPPAPAWDPSQGIHSHPTLICIRRHESDRNDKGGQGLYDQGYWAPGGGGYQIVGNTWPGAVTRAGERLGHPEWVWYALVPAEQAPIEVQDEAAWQLLQERGTQPWAGSGC